MRSGPRFAPGPDLTLATFVEAEMANLNHSISAKYAREILDYNPETGVFKWKWRDDMRKNDNARITGKSAGSVVSSGYLKIKINNRRYLAHRLAWLIVHGEWPPKQIDHIDCDKLNNRIANLRLANNQENQRNCGLQKNNSTGIKGVYWHKSRGKFVAEISVGDKRRHLGYFDTLAEATAARHAAEAEHFGAFRWVA
jgi:hypothetical protein